MGKKDVHRLAKQLAREVKDSLLAGLSSVRLPTIEPSMVKASQKRGNVMEKFGVTCKVAQLIHKQALQILISDDMLQRRSGSGLYGHRTEFYLAETQIAAPKPRSRLSILRAGGRRLSKLAPRKSMPGDWKLPPLKARAAAAGADAKQADSSPPMPAPPPPPQQQQQQQQHRQRKEARRTTATTRMSVAAFQAEDEHMLKFLAALSAIGMQVDEALWAKHRNAERLEALGELMGSLAELTCSDHKVIFEQVRDEAMRLCHCELGAILMLDKTSEHFSAYLPDGSQHLLRLPPAWAGSLVDLEHMFLAATVASKGSPIVITDSPADDEWQNCTEHRRFGLSTLQSAVAVPIFAMRANGKQEVYGVLELFNKVSPKGRYICFDREDLQLLKGLCSYAASAITISTTLKTSTASYKPFDETLIWSPQDSSSPFRKSSSASKLFDYDSEDAGSTEPGEDVTPERIIEGTNLMDWNFDATLLDTNELVGLLPPIFSCWSLQSSFRITDDTLQTFGIKVCAEYLPNPFHNSSHAWSVLQASNHMLITLGTEATSLLGKVDILALLVAALCHDLGHPGTNNLFQQKICSPLALRYNDVSILENHHAAMTFELLSKNPDANVLANLCQKDFRAARRTICRSILSTDLSVHERDLARLRTRQTKPFAKESDEDRELVVSAMLHAADLSNPCRGAALAEKWARLLAQEFLLQTEQEASEGIGVSGFMLNGYQASTEIFFITTFVKPLWDTMAVLFPPLDFYVAEIQKNLDGLKGSDEPRAEEKGGDATPQRSKMALQRRLSLNFPRASSCISRAFSRQATPISLPRQKTNEELVAKVTSVDTVRDQGAWPRPSLRNPKIKLTRRLSR